MLVVRPTLGLDVLPSPAVPMMLLTVEVSPAVSAVVWTDASLGDSVVSTEGVDDPSRAADVDADVSSTKISPEVTNGSSCTSAMVTCATDVVVSGASFGNGAASADSGVSATTEMVVGAAAAELSPSPVVDDVTTGVEALEEPVVFSSTTCTTATVAAGIVVLSMASVELTASVVLAPDSDVATAPVVFASRSATASAMDGVVVL